MRINHKLYKYFIAIIPLTLLINGCNKSRELKAVEQFSLISNDIKASSSVMIDDIHESCVRREEIEIQKLSMIAQPVVDAKGQLVFPLVNVRNRCQKWIPVVAGTNQLNTTLISYIESLGKLASGNTITFTQDVQTLGNSFEQFGKALNTAGVANISIEKTQQQAGLKIVDSLLNLWSSQFRYKNLKPVIICTDPYSQQYISLLQEIVDKVYLQKQLLEEEDAIKSRYNLAYKIAIKNSGSNGAALASTIVELQENFNQQIQEFDKRKEAGIAYVQILDETQRLHHALANSFQGTLTDKGVKTLCQNYFPSIRNEATTTSSLSVGQLKQANNLIKSYNLKVQPLIDKVKMINSSK